MIGRAEIYIKNANYEIEDYNFLIWVQGVQIKVYFLEWRDFKFTPSYSSHELLIS